MTKAGRWEVQQMIDNIFFIFRFPAFASDSQEHFCYGAKLGIAHRKSQANEANEEDFVSRVESNDIAKILLPELSYACATVTTATQMCKQHCQSCSTYEYGIVPLSLEIGIKPRMGYIYWLLLRRKGKISSFHTKLVSKAIPI